MTLMFSGRHARADHPCSYDSISIERRGSTAATASTRFGGFRLTRLNHMYADCPSSYSSCSRSQEAVAFPENEPYEFRLMSGQTIRLETDGSFFIDNKKCSGEAFMGADLC